LLYFVENLLQIIVHVDRHEMMFHFLKILLFKKILFPHSVFQDSCVTVVSKAEPERGPIVLREKLEF